MSATSNSTLDYAYLCQNSTDETTCAPSCTGLEACDECQCAVVPLTGEGPWGPVMDVLLSLLPILFLIVATIKPNPLSTTVSLPLAALLLFLVRLMYFASDPLLVSACIVLGIHEAITPLSM